MVFAVITTKGQIVIPSKIRSRCNMKAGTRVFIEESNGGVVIKPLTPDYFRKFAGLLPPAKKLSKMLLRERAGAKEKEDGYRK